MRVDQLLQEISDTPQEQEKITPEIQSKLLTFLKEKNIPDYGFNLDVYEALLPLTKKASKAESTTFTDNQQTDSAQIHAAKLAILFGTADKAIDYLKRYEKQYPQSQRLIYEACLFSLPGSGKWDLDLWRRIIHTNNPISPSDLIMRLFPFALKIEQHVQINRESIQKEIQEKIIEKYHQQFAKNYDQKTNISLEDFVKKEIEPQRKGIAQKATKKLDYELKIKLNLPETKLSPEQSNLLNEEKKSELAQAKLQEIISQLELEYKKKAEVSYQKLLHNKQTHIEQELKKTRKERRAFIDNEFENILSAKTPVETLKKYAAATAVYPRAAENKVAAELFFTYGIPEESFNLYLDLKPIDDENHIPNIEIDGEQINPLYKGYYLKKLSPSDPRAAILGKLTSCCQSLGYPGQAPTIHGITDSRGGFYVLCKKSDDTILSQCWAWRSLEGNIVFDSIESQIDFRKNHEILITDMFTQLAGELILSSKTPRVSVGQNGETPKNIGVFTATKPATPVNYNGYRDSAEQRIIADQSLPFLQVYQNNNLTSKLTIVPTTLNAEAIKQWCDLCVVNNSEKFIRIIEPYLEQAGLTRQDVDIYVNNVQQWLKLITSYNPEKYLNLQELLEAGINPDLCTPSNKTFLFTVAKAYQLEEVKLLIKHGADINWCDKQGNTVLHYIVTNNKALEIVNYLIKNKIEVNAKTNVDANTALHIAAYYKAWKVAHCLITEGKADAKAVNANKETVLHIAAYRKAWDQVLWLIEKSGADVNAKNYKGETILHLLVLSTRNAVSIKTLETIRYLIKNKIEVNVKINDDESTALHIAADFEAWEVVQCLIAEGKADANAVTVKKETVLHIAAHFQAWDQVQWLIEKGGADVNAQNHKGETILHLAVYTKNDVSVIKSLLNFGANIHLKNNRSDLPINIAAKKQSWELVKLLVVYDPNKTTVNSSMSFEGTPIQQAANAGNWSMVNWLLAHGADVNAYSVYTKSVLQHAAEAKNWDLVISLIEQHHADVNIPFDFGGSALLLAAKSERWDIVTRLVDQGANVNVTELIVRDTVLHIFAQQGKWQQVKWLIKHSDADVNLEYGSGLGSYRYILHSAVVTSDLKNVKWLLEHNADVKVQSFPHGNALHIAAELGKWKMVELLLTVMNPSQLQATNGSFKTAVEIVKENFPTQIDIINKLKKAAEEPVAQTSKIYDTHRFFNTPNNPTLEKISLQAKTLEAFAVNFKNAEIAEKDPTLSDVATLALFMKKAIKKFSSSNNHHNLLDSVNTIKRELITRDKKDQRVKTLNNTINEIEQIVNEAAKPDFQSIKLKK